MNRLAPALLLATLLLPTSAVAANDVVIDHLSGVESSRRQATFEFVVRDLAMALSGPPNHAVASLGLYEFEVSTDHRLAFLHVDPDAVGGSSAWNDLAESGEPGTIAYMPRVSFRKGLPWSFEVGADGGWLAGTRQFLLGGYGRWVFVGGWDKVPDAAIQIGYDGYVGNDQLDMGVFELDLSVGYTFKASYKRERPGTRFSPFVGYSFLMAHANPVSEVDGVSWVTAWAKNAPDGTDPRDFRFHRFFGGLEILSGQILFRAGGDITVPRDGPLMGAFNISLGARF